MILGIESVETLFTTLNSVVVRREGFGDWLFRGQGSNTWGLVPSLFRVPSFFGDVQAFEDCAKSSLRLRLTNQTTTPDRLVENNDYLLALLQHHGCPTRLLDFSFFPLVAVYHAVRQFLEAPTTGKLSVFALGSPLDRSDTLHGAEVVSPPHAGNDNLRAQGGCFIKLPWRVTDLWDTQYERCATAFNPSMDLADQIWRFDIPSHNVPAIFEFLQAQRSTASTLYPGNVGLAQEACDTARLEALRPMLMTRGL